MNTENKKAPSAPQGRGAAANNSLPKEIQGINCVLLNNGAHYQFIKDVSTRIATETALVANPVVKAAAERLANALKEEDRSLVLSQKNLSTDDIRELDIERDKLFAGYRSAVKGFLRMPVADVAQAAKELAQHLKDYSINPHMQLERETALIANLIDDCETKFAAQVARLGIQPYVVTLKTANTKLESLIHSRTDSDSTRILGALRIARRESDSAYFYLIKVANAFPIFVNQSDAAAFIDYMNELIKRYKEQVLTARKKKSDGNDPKKPGGGGKKPSDPKKPSDGKKPDDPKKPNDPKKPGGGGDSPKPGREEDPGEDQV